jgi:hypothetical protein
MTNPPQELTHLTAPAARRERVADGAGPVRRALRAWPVWTPYAAVAWSLAYCALAASWALGGPGYPFGPAADPENDSSLLWHADREVAASVVAVLCLAGVAVAGLVARRRVASPGPALARSFAVFGALAAVTLSVVVPDQRVLVGIGYLPIFVAGLPWDFPPIGYSEAWPWPVQNQLLLMLGGALWAPTALVAARHAAASCSRWAWRSGGARCSRGGSRCCAAGGYHRRWRSSRRRSSRSR